MRGGACAQTRARTHKRKSESLCELDWCLDVEIAIGCALRVGVPLKQGEPGEIICLAFEQVGDLWGQGLLAILEDAEEFSVRGNFVVAGLMELQEILFRTTQGVID